MRRAIAEQIDAINELSKIVARSTGETDAAAAARRRRCRRPPARPSQPAPRQEPPPANAASGRSAGPPAEPFGKPAGAVAVGRRRGEGRSGRRSPAAPPASRRSRAAERRGARLGRRPAAPRLVQRRRQPASARRSGRGCAAAGKRSPAQVVELLNSLSIDIARAIDHEASVELWDRYKRGERNVFTRRLYTLQGQKTFDELRRKYERDADFRQAVDNYIGDFERLLSQVSKDDADPTVSRMYLTSDTGKVYTMLAHAAGRLG